LRALISEAVGDDRGHAPGNADLRDLLLSIAPNKAGGINKRTFDHWVRRNVKRIVDGMRLVKVRENRRDADWYRVEDAGGGEQEELAL
jgi:hypothetical protein